MAQYQESGPVSSQELYGELESINDLLESVDDDIAAILAEIADEEAQTGHIPVLDDVVDNSLAANTGGDTLDARRQAGLQPPSGASAETAHAARAAISAVYREVQPLPGEPDVAISADSRNAVAFSREDFISLSVEEANDDSAEGTVTSEVAPDAPPATDPLDAWLSGGQVAPEAPAAARASAPHRPAAAIDPNMLADCTAEVVAGIVEEWLPVLREELSRRLGEAVTKALESSAPQR